jgi:hypothetical protein
MELETVPSEQVRPRRTRKAKQDKALTEAPGATGGVVYVARKPLKIGQKRYTPGDVVHEAAGWLRVESWVRSGYIEQVEV